jgi:hypothetical protein
MTAFEMKCKSTMQAGMRKTPLAGAISRRECQRRPSIQAWSVEVVPLTFSNRLTDDEIDPLEIICNIMCMNKCLSDDTRRVHYFIFASRFKSVPPFYSPFVVLFIPP